MAGDESNDFLERFNREGGAVPATNPEHLKKMWKCSRDPRVMGSATKTSGLGAAGIDPSELGDAPREKVHALAIRLELLRSLFERSVLHDYLSGDDFADEVFQAAASLPCDRDDVVEAMAQLAMKQRPKADCSELKREMIAHGIDPDHPRVDSRFLAWIKTP